MPRREIAKHHTVVHTRIKRLGFQEGKSFVLYLLAEDGSAPAPLVPLIDYFGEHGRTRSISWQNEVARAVGLLIDFLVANSGLFKALSGNRRPQIFSAFAEALVAGTIDAQGSDSSELFWQPKKLKRASHLLNMVTAFSDWLVERYETTALNPWKAASVAEQIAYWRRFDKRRASALLSHAASLEDAVARSRLARSVRVLRKTSVTTAQPVKSFPEERIWDLLAQGLANARPQKRRHVHDGQSLRDMMIVVLLHGGGLRESEPFHLYVSDVGINAAAPHSAVVRLYHPEQGSAPADYLDPFSRARVRADREEYLRLRWGLQPRNLVVGRFHAGWKDLQLANAREQYALVHWFPSYWGEIFLKLFKLYVMHCRSRHAAHPYLFVSHKEQYEGEPYTVDAFRQAHGRAVRRTGLVPSAELGTSPHGHRHAYGRRLAESGVPKLVIQRAMHHKSPQSQDVYTAPDDGQVEQVLRAAQVSIEASPPSLLLDAVLNERRR
ncbi:gamma-mobile-trio recombinase GmtY [Hydrogenophaga sp.]|uniref:gamma-mobile-trio recombinase GmtY n=1 Tax=Hydrogenophaga sp. TaxID=1904254 RepID=UPI002FC99BEB